MLNTDPLQNRGLIKEIDVNSAIGTLTPGGVNGVVGTVKDTVTATLGTTFGMYLLIIFTTQDYFT